MSAALALCSLCAACELAGAWAGEKRGVARVVLFVRLPLVGEPPQGPPDGSAARPFPSLGAALAGAPDGARLRMGEGIYREPLLITRSVVLLGRGAGRTRIVAPADAAAAVEVRGAEHVQIYGISMEGAAACAAFFGGAHRLQKVEKPGCSQAGLLARGARIDLLSSAISDVSSGREGRGIDLDGGSLEARRVSMRSAGRRAVVLHRARGLLEDVEVQGSSLSALQATDGAEARVVRGSYEGHGGAALYAGGSRLAVEGARVRRGDYAVLGFRGAELTVIGGELTDYAVAGGARGNSHGSIQGGTLD